MATYKIKIGDQVHELPDGAEKTQDFQALMGMLGVEVTVKVRPTREGARAVAPLVLLPPRQEQKPAPPKQGEQNPPASEPDGPTLIEVLSLPVTELGLPLRVSRALWAGSIVYVWHLVQRTDAELNKVKDIGSTSIAQIKQALADHDLSLNMDVSGVISQLPQVRRTATAEDIDFLSKRIDSFEQLHRVGRPFHQAGFGYLWQLAKMSLRDMKRIRRVDWGTVDKVVLLLHEQGLTFCLSIPDDIRAQLPGA